MIWLLVFLGGAAGAPLRYLADRAVQARHDTVFPWGTLGVNVSGSLLLGALTGAALSAEPYALLGTGLCGALTTYSTFSYETLRLAKAGSRGLAALNAAATTALTLAAAFLGVALGTAAG
ncbi:hypothetical protein BJP40_08740 [Streptomyces sp. CC53]|uniref:fluoride efflux transporter FluC n=1 Tax=unclassified Streptomyces TaxID=2593676 RepID=UPI0008DDD8EC|nr:MULTISPECIES: CrcB family protein [unclassified Streptomyces]OII60928.1 hypothetical protein BJP40_08740 [Streptomyces sp. CC53]